ncbi:MAG: hypothetical protein IJV68_03005 [Clostridia bacterium]|nr:hypothetical protein [Clostridia bacterium]
MSKGKKIFCIILAIFLGALAFGTISTVFANDTKPAGAIFNVGGLDPETGEYVENDKTIYTEKAIKCNGLRIEPDFDSTVTYDVYFYDEHDTLLYKELGLEKVYVSEFELAEYARIVIHPEIPEDVEEKDFKVDIFDVVKYSDMLDITVSKEEAVYDFNNLYDEKTMLKGYTIVADGGIVNGIDEYIEEPTSKVSNLVKLDKYEDTIDVWVRHKLPPVYTTFIMFIDAEGGVIESNSYRIETFDENGWKNFSFEIPDNAVGVVFIMPIDAECYSFYRN